MLISIGIIGRSSAHATLVDDRVNQMYVNGDYTRVQFRQNDLGIQDVISHFITPLNLRFLVAGILLELFANSNNPELALESRRDNKTSYDVLKRVDLTNVESGLRFTMDPIGFDFNQSYDPIPHFHRVKVEGQSIGGWIDIAANNFKLHWVPDGIGVVLRGDILLPGELRARVKTTHYEKYLGKWQRIDRSSASVGISNLRIQFLLPLKMSSNRERLNFGDYKDLNISFDIQPWSGDRIVRMFDHQINRIIRRKLNFRIEHYLLAELTKEIKQIFTPRLRSIMMSRRNTSQVKHLALVNRIDEYDGIRIDHHPQQPELNQLIVNTNLFIYRKTNYEVDPCSAALVENSTQSFPHNYTEHFESNHYVYSVPTKLLSKIFTAITQQGAFCLDYVSRSNSLDLQRLYYKPVGSYDIVASDSISHDRFDIVMPVEYEFNNRNSTYQHLICLGTPCSGELRIQYQIQQGRYYNYFQLVSVELNDPLQNGIAFPLPRTTLTRLQVGDWDFNILPYLYYKMNEFGLRENLENFIPQDPIPSGFGRNSSRMSDVIYMGFNFPLDSN